MENYILKADEVILYEHNVSSNNYKKIPLYITLTSQNIFLEKVAKNGQRTFIESFALENIKFFNEKPQVEQKMGLVKIQTIEKNLEFDFGGLLEARKFTLKIVDLLTGTTFTKRCADKVKGAIDMVDDTLGLDVRDTIKGVLQSGVKGVLINGTGKKDIKQLK